MRHWLRLAALLCVLALVAACNGDTATDDTDAPDPDTEDPADTGTDDTADTAGDVQLDEPVRIVFLVQDPRTSADPNVLPDYAEAAWMARDEINDDGGIGGHDVEVEIVETPAFGEEVVNAFNLALQQDPTVIIGPISSSGLLTIADRIATEGIPVLHFTTEPQAALDAPAGSEWLFAARPRNDSMARAAAQYAVDELGATSIGLMYINASFGQVGADAIRDQLGDTEIAAERSFEFNADDLTEESLAMDGVDVVLDWGTPNTVALATRTFAQQGLDVAHLSAAALGFGFFPDMVGDTGILEGKMSIVDCNPVGDDHAAQWRERWLELHDYEPSYAGAEVYDAMYMIKQVIEDAGASDPETIRDGLNEITFTGGVCAEEYRNTGDNILHHESVIVEYSGGDIVTIEHFDDLGALE